MIRNYKQILEAINRGINLALDDFDDEPISKQKSGKIINKNHTKEYLDLAKDFVDLGLPSGTWWAKANLGATCGDTIESWYGDYFSWGDPESDKEKWGEAQYKFTGKMLKYNEKDGLTQLEPEDDQATQFIHIHNFNIHIPTKEQCEELIKYCEIVPKKGYKEELTFKALDIPMNLNGYIVRSKVNGNEIFFPNAGYYFIDENSQINEQCYIQSSTRYSDPYRYYCLELNENGKGFANSSFYRTSGLPIRPVCNL